MGDPADAATLADDRRTAVLEALRALRIEKGQGFHLGHPQTAAAIKAEYERGHVPDLDLKLAVGS